jgi:hypothetical protein
MVKKNLWPYKYRVRFLLIKRWPALTRFLFFRFPKREIGLNESLIREQLAQWNVDIKNLSYEQLQDGIKGEDRPATYTLALAIWMIDNNRDWIINILSNKRERFKNEVDFREMLILETDMFNKDAHLNIGKKRNGFAIGRNVPEKFLDVHGYFRQLLRTVSLLLFSLRAPGGRTITSAHVANGYLIILFQFRVSPRINSSVLKKTLKRRKAPIEGDYLTESLSVLEGITKFYWGNYEISRSKDRVYLKVYFSEQRLFLFDNQHIKHNS